MRSRVGAWRLVKFPALDAEQQILQDIAPADPMFTAQPVQLADQGQRLHRLAVEAARRSLPEADGEQGRLGGSLLGGDGQGEDVGRGLVPGVEQRTQADAGPPQVAIDGHMPASRFLDRQPAPPGVGQFLLERPQVPLADGGEHLQARILGRQGRLQPKLIVALGGRAVRHGPAPLGHGHEDQFPGHQVAREGRAKETAGLVDRSRLQDGQSKVTQELFLAVEDVCPGCAQFQSQFSERLQVNALAEVERQGDDLVAALVGQPVQSQARFQIAVEGQNDASHGAVSTSLVRREPDGQSHVRRLP